MKRITKFVSSRVLFAIVAVLACWLSAFPTAAAQTSVQGQDAVYNLSGNPTNSPAFIDASMFASSPPPPRDFCKVLNWVLTHGYPATGGVIDARGLSSTNTNMTCSVSPWAGIANPPPSTILLPATGDASPPNPIVIISTWVLPPNTHLIGEGDGIPCTSGSCSPSSPGTTIQAATGFTSGTAMISFGQSSLCTAACTGISVRNLTLDGQGQSIHGIDNGFSQDLSYVDHVGLYRILGTGLSVSGNAKNSGPYSNIAFDLGGLAGTSSTVCANINGLSGTRGIHGLSCTSESISNDPPAAVLLDSSNNSIEDVRIVGFYDGILVGWNANAQSNVLINIIGDHNYIRRDASKHGSHLQPQHGHRPEHHGNQQQWRGRHLHACG